MSVPEHTAAGGIHQLTWVPEAVSIRIDRLIQDSKYQLTGEILVESTVPGTAKHLHQARMNLTSTAARQTLGKALSARMDHDWGSIIEQACVLVLTKYREGTPVIQIADHPMPEGLQYRLTPFLQERQPTLFFGEGDTGKSWFAIYLSVLVAQGLQQWGMEAEPGNVLFLDYETDEDTIWERVNLVCQGMDEPIPDNFYYRHMYQPIAGDIEQIQRIVLDYDISLVVIDSAAPAVGEPENAQETTDYFRALRSLRKSSLTVAHVAKGGKINEPFGSIFWRNLPRANFRVNAEHEAGDTRFVLGLRHTKSNNGRRLKDMAYELNFDDDGLTFKPAQPMDYPALAKGLSLGQRISSALRDGAMGIKELAEVLEESEPKVRTTLHRGRGRFFTPLETNLGHVLWGNLISKEV